MKKLTGSVLRLHFMRNNSVVIDTTHGLKHLPQPTMRIKTTLEKSAKPQAVLSDNALTIPLKKSKTVTAFIDHPAEWNTTGTLTPLEKITEAPGQLISHSMSMKSDRKVALRVTNTAETPFLIKQKTQVAETSVVTPEQAKFIKPMDMTILSVIPEQDPDLNAYLNELLRRNTPEQQSITFWFPTQENPGKIEDHTPIQTRILKELYELKETEKLNPKDDAKSRKKIPE